MLHLLLVLAGAIPRRSERGATAVEYALIVTACAIALAGGIFALRVAIAGIYATTQDSMDNSVP